uniref:hypothetical protein n=1 Tax=Herbidospora sakaeratensis TaxID=564415 RepID=UPI0007861424|nr:hypothetical protein [Herbidospora sakaeratensis]
MAEETYRFGNVTGPVNAGSGTQNVGGIHQRAGRDIYSGTGHQVVNQELHADLDRLRQALGELKLTSAERRSANRELTAVEEAIRREEPDRQEAGRHLEVFVSGLERAGALAGAGTALIDAAARIAAWLGPFGYAVLALLGL